MMKYFLEPLGCQMNKSDAERIRTVLDGMGIQETRREEEADLLGLVSCSVRQKSINRVYGRIEKWNRWKNKKNVLTFLSGCILPADEQNFLSLFDLVFRINDLPRLPDMIRQYGVVTPLSHSFGAPVPEALESRLENVCSISIVRTENAPGTGDSPAIPGSTVISDRPIIPGPPAIPGSTVMDNIQSKEEFDKAFWKIKPKYESTFQAYIPIQNGCDKFCTFCAVPYTRGREVSRPSSEIIAEVREVVQAGYKSITLLGQNVNSYGLDQKGGELDFARLLAKIGELENGTGHDFWLYFTSPHPSDMTDGVLETICRYRCLARHIHLPIQSGDDEILRKMNRSYTLADYRRIVDSIFRILPDATLFTDIIVGFSGETEEQFLHTVEAIREFQFDMAYVAQYSPRPGAVSFEWPDNVPVEEKKRRYEYLTQELKKVTLARNQRMIGKTYKVLVEGCDRKAGYLSARTEGLIPVRFPSQDTTLVGKFVSMKVHSVTPFAGDGDKV